MNSQLFQNKGIRYILAGWSIFITENVIITENRQFVIDRIGDRNYHYCFNSLSTIATTSIIYGFLRYGFRSGPTTKIFSNRLSQTIRGGARVLGLIGFSQTVPQLYPTIPPPTDDATHGLKRVTRHPMLFSLAFLSLSMAISPYLTHTALFSGPIAFAFLGGSHQDSRYRRDGRMKDEANTSFLPFRALFEGRQSWMDLAMEMKLTNAFIAYCIAVISLV